MFDLTGRLGAKTLLLAGMLASSVAVSGLGAQSSAPPAAREPVHYQPNRFSRRAVMYYAAVWGIDSLRVKTVESGELVRFSYRVLDANRAKELNDKKVEPVLIDLRARVKLVVPEMEKVGKLRQSAAPEAGRSYWMTFSNKGRPVQRGDRVTVMIGQFRADGLVVE